ncbi:MAG: hypothetical protein ABF868_09875 [Sporolactobacillus sp.]
MKQTKLLVILLLFLVLEALFVINWLFLGLHTADLAAFTALLVAATAAVAAWRAALLSARAAQLSALAARQQAAFSRTQNDPYLLIDGDRDFRFLYRGESDANLFQNWDEDGDGRQPSTGQFFIKLCNVGSGMALHIHTQLSVENEAAALKALKDDGVRMDWDVNQKGDFTFTFERSATAQQSVFLPRRRVLSSLYMPGGTLRLIQAPEQFVVLYNLLICRGLSLELNDLPYLSATVAAEQQAGTRLRFTYRIVPVDVNVLASGEALTAARCSFKTVKMQVDEDGR